MSYKVELTYFQDTGKYYSTGEYTSKKEALFKIWEEVRQMARDKRLPGLYEGSVFPYILVNVPEHEHNHPRLIYYF